MNSYLGQSLNVLVPISFLTLFLKHCAIQGQQSEKIDYSLMCYQNCFFFYRRVLVSQPYLAYSAQH